MTFEGWGEEDFAVFDLEGLELRMEGIRSRIQPKFHAIAQELCMDLSVLTGNQMHVHIARHARRKVNPPVDTWMALCHSARGYKQHPHFEVGLFNDRVFIRLALIYELPNKREIADRLLKQQKKLFQALPREFMISVNHMKKDSTKPLASMFAKDITTILQRFRDVKSAEFLIGRVLPKDDPILVDGPTFIQLARDTFTQLVPMYHAAMG